MARLSIPTTARLSPSLRVDPSNAAVQRIIHRLSRQSLISLALDWVQDGKLGISSPYLVTRAQDEDSDDFYPPTHSLRELYILYSDMQARKGPRRDAIYRILEGDWRHGLTLYQLAMADLQHLYDHPMSQRWSAYRVLPLKGPQSQGDGAENSIRVDERSLNIPRFHPSSFLANLQAAVVPDIKAHYQFDRPPHLPLLLLRIFVIDSPYNTELALSRQDSYAPAADFGASTTLYIAFPDGSPFLYISKPQTIGTINAGEGKNLRGLVVEGIPKALSRPRHRYTLKPTNFSSRNLAALLHIRGPGRYNFATGGWSIYANSKTTETPLNNVLPAPTFSGLPDGADRIPSTESSRSTKRSRSVSGNVEHGEQKRMRLVAQARFGDFARVSDGKGVERVDILMEDPYPHGLQSRVLQTTADKRIPPDVPSRGRRRGDGSAATARRVFRHEVEDNEETTTGDDVHTAPLLNSTWVPTLKITFHGSHVFAGVRQLAEAGIIDGQRMPGWLTGEAGVTIGAVRNGKLRGHIGSSM